MNSTVFSGTVDALSEAIGRWAAQTRPIYHGEFVRLQGMDLSNRVMGLDDLYFVDEPDHFRPRPGEPLHLLNQEILNTGTLRNSFFPQVLAAHCQDMNLWLNVSYRGRFQIIVYQSRIGHAAMPLAERILTSDDPTSELIEIGPIGALPRGARLFWVARALGDGCEMRDASWQVQAPAATEGRMVVLMRTYGRTDDIRAMLARFQDTAMQGAHGHMLANTLFLIYDATPDVTADRYADLPSLSLNTFVMAGPNLGGGGNMSVELLALEQAVAKSGVTVNEVVLTDDDLIISLESLSRNWGATLFRRDNAFHTLPILMRSEPRRLWEDGGFWGRFTKESPQGQRTDVGPRLLRHMREFGGQAHLDDMARLHHAEYGTFILLSMPFLRVVELGLPTAFFLRGDDIEYSLRHARTGGVILSNPNMAAWHEPMHSYAQEYMSIAHGILINMAYGQDKPDELAAFFHARALSHLSVSDVVGLTVYAEALADLVAMDRLLEPGFADHYIAMITRFKSFDSAFAVIPDEVVDTMQDASHRQGRLTARARFLYMPTQADEPPLDGVVLFNPHTERRAIYNPNEAERIAALSIVAARFFASLSAFTQGYDNLRAHYAARMAAASAPSFWAQVTEGAAFEVLHA